MKYVCSKLSGAYLEEPPSCPFFGDVTQRFPSPWRDIQKTVSKEAISRGTGTLNLHWCTRSLGRNLKVHRKSTRCRQKALLRFFTMRSRAFDLRDVVSASVS